MTSYILGPEGSMNTRIQLKDIVGVRTSELSYFNSKAHNLYVLVTKENKEHFYLFVYSNKEQMKVAFKALSAIIATGKSLEHIIDFSPEVSV